jgi:hypothetical protein
LGSHVGIEGGAQFFDNDAFKHAVRSRVLLGLPQLAGCAPLEICGGCAKPYAPQIPLLKTCHTHAWSCQESKLFGARHNYVRDLLAKVLGGMCKAGSAVPGLGVSVKKEEFVQYMGPLAAGVQARAPGIRMDLVVRAGDKTYWIDVGVVDPGCARSLANGSAEKALSGAVAKEQDKRRGITNKWPGIALESGVFEYVPFIFEATGAEGLASVKFLKQSGVSGEKLRAFREQVSVTLARFGGRLVEDVYVKSLSLQNVLRPQHRRAHAAGAGGGEAGAPVAPQ